MFNCVKIMTKSGATIDEIVKYFNVSHATVSRIRSVETFEEYKQMLSAIRLNAKKKAAKQPQQEQKEDPRPQVIEHRQTVTMVANHYMMEEMKTQTEYLKLIKAVLTAIAEELGCFKEKEEK